jgi:hypothetical protein
LNCSYSVVYFCFSRKTKIYHTVGTFQKSNRKTTIYHTVGTFQKSNRKTKIYHTVGTFQKSNRKTKIVMKCVLLFRKTIFNPVVLCIRNFYIFIEVFPLNSGISVFYLMYDVVFNITAHLKGCTERYRNNPTQTSNKL